MRINIIVPGEPVPQPRQRYRVFFRRGKPVATNYTPKNHPVNDYKADVQKAAREAHRGEVIDEPIFMKVLFCFPRPKNKTWKTKSMPRYPHTKRPDIDNLMKSTCDALNGVLFRDDSLIYSCVLEKKIAEGGEQPFTHIMVQTEKNN